MDSTEIHTHKDFLAHLHLTIRCYNRGMNTQPTSRNTYDPGHIGLVQDDLPAFEDTREDTRFDFTQWWPEDKRNNPFELEIGSGKGTFLVQQASQLKDVNYLGIEYAREYWLKAADRIRRHALENVRMLHTNAVTFVEWFVPDKSFRQVHIYFPDPWPKTRHNKRRLIQAPLLRQLHRILDDKGFIRLVTDHDDYFAWMNDHIDQVDTLFERAPFESPVSAGEGEVVGTNFERKYRREGRPFNAVILKKLDSGAPPTC